MPGALSFALVRIPDCHIFIGRREMQLRVSSFLLCSVTRFVRVSVSSLPFDIRPCHRFRLWPLCDRFNFRQLRTYLSYGPGLRPLRIFLIWHFYQSPLLVTQS